MNNLNDKILQAMEQLWEYKLPNIYRNCLLNDTLKNYSNKYFNFFGSSDGSFITDFFEITKDFNNNLLLKQKYSGTRVPKNCLPIARDVYGNLILLSVKDVDRGKVYFWDHNFEAEDGVEPDYSNLTLIADSFDEFIHSLKSENEVEI